MQVSQHGANLIQLTRFPGIFPMNAYLVREDDGFTLVDTMIGGSSAGILAAAARFDLPIKRIALTHAHGDHVGSLDALHDLLPDAEVSISRRDARFLTGDKSLDPDEPAAKLRGGFADVKTRPTRLLEPGDRVGSLEVVASPGHTPGHVAFFDRRDGSLIAGDAFITHTGLAVAGTWRLRFPFAAMGTWHKPTALASARALCALQPGQLAVGHGAVLENPVVAMDRAIAEAERSLRLVKTQPE